MNSVGIDLHRRRSQVAVVDDAGAETLSRPIANDPQTFLELLAEIDGESKIALEATFGWEWLVELLEGAGYEVHLAHPLRTKAIAAARVKTDAVDARTLAYLLRADLVPESCIAPREARDLRELLRHRVVLTRIRTSLKCRVHGLISRYGVIPPHGNTFGPRGLVFLRELELRPPSRRRLDSTRRRISDLDREMDEATRKIASPTHDERVRVLTQIRGIGRYTAMLVIAEIGDVHRFEAAQALRLGRPDADRARLRSACPPRTHKDGRGLIEPPGPARHNGPPRAAG